MGLMNLIEIIRQTIGAMRAHKMRSFLTMFGIVWGIASVIILVGLGRGFNSDQKKRMKSIGVDLMIVWAGRTSSQAGGYAAGRELHLNITDAQILKEQAYLFKTVSPEVIRPVSEVSQYNAALRPVRGVWPEYQNFRSLTMSEGRLMTQEDEEQGASSGDTGRGFRTTVISWQTLYRQYGDDERVSVRSDRRPGKEKAEWKLWERSG